MIMFLFLPLGLEKNFRCFIQVHKTGCYEKNADVYSGDPQLSAVMMEQSDLSFHKDAHFSHLPAGLSRKEPSEKASTTAQLPSSLLQ